MSAHDQKRKEVILVGFLAGWGKTYIPVLKHQHIFPKLHQPLLQLLHARPPPRQVIPLVPNILPIPLLLVKKIKHPIRLLRLDPRLRDRRVREHVVQQTLRLGEASMGVVWVPGRERVFASCYGEVVAEEDGGTVGGLGGEDGGDDGGG